MAFTTVTVTGTIETEPDVAANGATVTFTLNTTITDGDTAIAPKPQVATCDSSGDFSIDLVANDDTTTSPAGSFYHVLITSGRPLDKFKVIIPASRAPTVNLFAIAELDNPSPLLSSVTKLVAGAGIDLTPDDGLGVVTVAVSGGGSGGFSAPSEPSPLGAARTIDFGGSLTQKDEIGVLTADLTVTIANFVSGSRGIIAVEQPASGGPWGLSINDGTGAAAVGIGEQPGDWTWVAYLCDSSNVYVTGYGSNGAVTSFNSRIGAVSPGNADYLAVAHGGLTGATAAARFVGGTTTGAPTSGTFAKGDFIVTQDGAIWICTAPGTPGTWAQVSGSGTGSVLDGGDSTTTPDLVIDGGTSSG